MSRRKAYNPSRSSHTIYFKTSDNISNIEGESGEWDWQFYKDTIPPAAVTDLAVNDLTRTSVELTWTASGNDANTGTASNYDIRYSTDNITADNWDLATQCTGEPAPSTANSTETFTVTGLSENTSYYFALKTADEVPNWSTLSNVLSRTTRSGGGGGGGGGGAERKPSGITKVANRVSPDGVFMGDVSAESGDGKVILDIEEGTTGLTEEGKPLSEISITEMEEPPAPPADSSIIGLTYDLGPDGATFDPPITLTFTYNPDEIQEGVNEEDLVIAMWDEDAGEWVVLEGCTVDPVTHTITAHVSHFTAFTVLTSPHPAAFSTTDLAISPTQVNTGETITISVLVTNTGDLTGSYEVILKIDGEVIAVEDVTLAGGDSETMTFTTSKGIAGTYAIEINGLSGTFTVKRPPVRLTTAPTVPAAAPAPASFTVSDLSVTPGEVVPDEQVTISAVVANTGGSEGSYTVFLKINGVEEAKKEVTLGPDESESVIFTTAKDVEGSYTININAQIGRFNVIAPLPVAELPAEPARPVNWAPIGGIIGGVLVISLVLWLAVFRRRLQREHKNGEGS